MGRRGRGLTLAALCLHLRAGKQPSLAQFTEEVVGPFMLSMAEKGAACQVPLSHDGALPKPQTVSSMIDEDSA